MKYVQKTKRIHNQTLGVSHLISFCLAPRSAAIYIDMKYNEFHVLSQLTHKIDYINSFFSSSSSSSFFVKSEIPNVSVYLRWITLCVIWCQINYYKLSLYKVQKFHSFLFRFIFRRCHLSRFFYLFIVFCFRLQNETPKGRKKRIF